MSTKRIDKRYCKVLRQLAKLEWFKKFKVTVCEGEFNEEKKQNEIAPLTFFNSYKDLDNKNSNRILNDKSVENSTEQGEISFENKNETEEDYPDSSDLSDDEWIFRIDFHIYKKLIFSFSVY